MPFKIYVGCLPGEATEESVKKIFSKFGPIKMVDLVKKKTNKCIGSGYIECGDEKTFNAILSSDIYYDDRKLETSKYLEKSELQKLHEDINLRKILVKNIPKKFENEELAESFSIFGNVLNAFISVEKNQKFNKPSNYGIVIFEERLGAYKALNAKFLIKGAPVVVRLHRFKNVGDAVYNVRGKKILAKDLIDIQIGRAPKDNIADLMGPFYPKLVKEFEKQIDVYEELMRQDRRKLKKDCKKRKDHSLKKKLIDIERKEKAEKRGKGENEEEKNQKKYDK